MRSYLGVVDVLQLFVVDRHTPRTSTQCRGRTVQAVRSYGGIAVVSKPRSRVRSAPGALSLSAPLEGEGQEGEDDDEEEPYTHSGGGPSSPTPFRAPLFAARTLKCHRSIPGHSIVVVR